MKKSSTLKRKKPTSQPQSAAPEIPKDLSDKWGAVEAINTCFRLIEGGNFKYSWLEAAQKSLSFLAALHEQSFAEVLKHPDCALIPQVKEHLESLEKEKTQTAEQPALQAVQ